MKGAIVVREVVRVVLLVRETSRLVVRLVVRRDAVGHLSDGGPHQLQAPEKQ
jgi:hypothetical protein